MSKNLFNSIQLKSPGKNKFDLTHDVKLSTDMGWLTPVCCFDCVPGDHFKISGEALIRFAPLVSPVMHRFDVFIHYWFVPNRIVWDGWEEWITDPASTRVFPYIVGDYINGDPKLASYLGLPSMTAEVPSTAQINALPFAAYQKIYVEFYRDQNLIPDLIPNGLQDGANNGVEWTTLQRRAWMHDYFTSCLPFAQKGASVDIPLGDVVLKATNYTPVELIDAASKLKAQAGTPSVQPVTGIFQDSAVAPVQIDPKGSLGVEATTITDLRRAFRLQEWLEKQARGGTRYTEQIRSQFDVISSDARLQRPEFIGGTRQPIVISEVLNTSGTFDAADPTQPTSPPQGNMAGHGVAYLNGHNGSYFCEEHGYIIGIMSVMPQTAYQQGIAKHFLKTTDQFEYYWPSFANIGEQAVKKIEVYGLSADPEETFGYIPRYAEYKFVNNRVAGQFATTLNTWHAGRIFDNEPELSVEFIECDPTKRIFAVTDPDVDSIYCHVLNRVSAIRPMPKYGNPYM